LGDILALDYNHFHLFNGATGMSDT